MKNLELKSSRPFTKLETIFEYKKKKKLTPDEKRIKKMKKQKKRKKFFMKEWANRFSTPEESQGGEKEKKNLDFVKVKTSYNDTSAGFMQIQGNALVHLATFITLLFVKSEPVSTSSEECQSFLETLIEF